MGLQIDLYTTQTGGVQENIEVHAPSSRNHSLQKSIYVKHHTHCTMHCRYLTCKHQANGAHACTHAHAHAQAQACISQQHHCACRDLPHAVCFLHPWDARDTTAKTPHMHILHTHARTNMQPCIHPPMQAIVCLSMNSPSIRVCLHAKKDREIHECMHECRPAFQHSTPIYLLIHRHEYANLHSCVRRTKVLASCNLS